MSNIKKMYQEIHQLLADNKKKKVSTIFDQLEELMIKKKNASGQESCVLKDQDGQVVAIFCYYHKRYELLKDVEYGKKASSSTGFNTMCKEGVSNWTKQQRVRKFEESNILVQLSQNLVKVEDIGTIKEELLEKSKKIIAREDGHGFDDADEALEANI